MKVLICGGRNVGRPTQSGDIAKATNERKFVTDYLSGFHSEKPISLVIGGDEGGAERIGLHWAALNKIPVSVWERKAITNKKTITNVIGKVTRGRVNAAETTIRRNMRMLAGSTPDLVIAFGGGESTTALLQEARAKGIEVLEVALPAS